MSTMQEHELESEFEHELHETELEASEHEGVLGSIGNVLGGLLGEGESTGESEFEGAGELNHEFELEQEFEHDHEFEMEMELEAGEQFSFGGFLKKALPVLKQVARVAAPMVGTAIGGPFGGMIGGLAAKALSEQELEMELEMEGAGELETEMELETEQESEHEVAHEIAAHETTMHEALAEMMAEAASQEMHEGQAEAMAGAAVMTVLSPRDRRALRHLLPHLVCGAAVLTRILRRRRITRPAVRAVPTIMRRTVKSLKRQAAAGRPITRRAAARTAARQVHRVLGNPRAARAAIVRNIRAGRAIKRRPRRYAAGRG
jgi:hypothetical protein